VVLMDFGAGRDPHSDRPRRITGTPVYMAPELFAGSDVTPQADLYSLGVLLYHLVTGAYPVNARTSAEVGAAHARGDRTHLRDRRPELPAAFIAVVERAVASDPADRFESAGAMEQALTRALTSLRGAGDRADSVDNGSNAAWGPRGRRVFA